MNQTFQKFEKLCRSLIFAQQFSKFTKTFFEKKKVRKKRKTKSLKKENENYEKLK